MVNLVVILDLIALVIGLVGIYFTINLYKRTRNGLKKATIYMLLSLVMYIFVRASSIINEYAETNNLLVTRIFSVVFISMFAISLYNIKKSFDDVENNMRDGKK